MTAASASGGGRCLDSWEAALRRAQAARSPEELWAAALSGPSGPPGVTSALDFFARLQWGHVTATAALPLRRTLQALRSPARARPSDLDLPWPLLQLLPPPLGALEALDSWLKLPREKGAPLGPVMDAAEVLPAFHEEVEKTQDLYEALRLPHRDRALVDRYEREPVVQLWHWLAWSRLASQSDAPGVHVAAAVRRARAVVAAHELELRSPRGKGRPRHLAQLWDVGALLPPDSQLAYLPWLPAVRQQLVAAQEALAQRAGRARSLAVLLQPSEAPAHQRLAYYWLAQGVVGHVDTEVLCQASTFCSFVQAQLADDEQRAPLLQRLFEAEAEAEAELPSKGAAFPALLRRDP